MTDPKPILIRFPWFTLYGMPEHPGRMARARCVAAMVVHELVEVVSGSARAHSMTAAARYSIGAPPITVPASRRGSLILARDDEEWPDVASFGSRVVELRVYTGGVTSTNYESIYGGTLKEIRYSDPQTGTWVLPSGKGQIAYVTGQTNSGAAWGATGILPIDSYSVAVNDVSATPEWKVPNPGQGRSALISLQWANPSGSPVDITFTDLDGNPKGISHFSPTCPPGESRGRFIVIYGTGPGNGDFNMDAT